jgi:hypothetical protein
MLNRRCEEIQIVNGSRSRVYLRGKWEGRIGIAFILGVRYVAITFIVGIHGTVEAFGGTLPGSFDAGTWDHMISRIFTARLSSQIIDNTQQYAIL